METTFLSFAPSLLGPSTSSSKKKTELIDSFYAQDGMDFVMEVMEMYPAVESLVVTSIAFSTGAFHIHLCTPQSFGFGLSG
jgi:hypothetical protein